MTPTTAATHRVSLQEPSLGDPASLPPNPGARRVDAPQGPLPFKVKEMTEADLRTLAEELAPAVEKATGWKLDVSALDFRVCKRSETLSTKELDRTDRRSVKRFKSCVLAMFVPPLEDPDRTRPTPEQPTVYLFREALQVADEASVRTLVFHELVHAAQYLRHPQFFQRITEARKTAISVKEKQGRESDAFVRADDEGVVRLAWLEAQAWTLHQRAYPGVRLSTRRRDNLKLIATPPSYKRVRDFRRNPPPPTQEIASRLYRLLHPKEGAVDQLFEHNALLDALAGRARGEPLEVRVPERTTNEELEDLKADLKYLYGIAGTEPRAELLRGEQRHPIARYRGAYFGWS